MKNLIFAVITLATVLTGQAVVPSLDNCAYPANTPLNQQLQYGTVHKEATWIQSGFSDPAENWTSLYESDAWAGVSASTNDISDPEYLNPMAGTLAMDFYGYQCGSYSADCDQGVLYGYGCDLLGDLNTFLSQQPPPPGNTVTETHDATSYSVTDINASSSGSVEWQVSGSLGDPYTTTFGGNLGLCRDNHTNCQTDGMPKWFIDEPYINLWVKDCPVFYTTSLGEKIEFKMAYKQYDTRPGYTDTSVPPTGWSHNWFSYVRVVVPMYLSSTNGSVGQPMPGPTGPININTNWAYTNDYRHWQAILYATDDGEDYFNSDGYELEANSGLNLIPEAGGCAAGFKLVHPDGCVDEYTLLSTNRFSFGIVTNEGRIYDAVTNASKLVMFGPYSFYCKSNNYVENSQDANLAIPFGQQVGFSSWDAVLTKRTDPYGNAITLTYSTHQPFYLQTITDYDANTTYLSYGGGVLTGVSMPYGRSASFGYANGLMTSSTDAQGMSSSFSYTQLPYTNSVWADTNVFLSSMTTPYGTTTFNHYESAPIIQFANPPHFTTWAAGPGGSGAICSGATSIGAVSIRIGCYGGSNQVNKACTVNLPDGSHELYMYRYDSQNVVPKTYPSYLIPYSALCPWESEYVDDGLDQIQQDTTSGINHLLSTRNSFHWNRQQYAHLSTTNILQLAASDYANATMKHWLEADTTRSAYPQSAENNVSDQLSMVRAASPNGIQSGAMTWFYHSGQIEYLAANNLPGDSPILTEATILPTGDCRTKIFTYDALGQLDSIQDTFTALDGSAQTRTTSYDYNSVQVYDAQHNYLYEYYRPGDYYPPCGGYSLAYSADGLKVDATDVAGGTTSYYYNNRHQVTGIKHANGLTTTNYYAANGFLMSSIDLEANATTLFTFSNGLLFSSTDPLGLTVQYAWDNLSRLTQLTFPDGTTISNNYKWLDIVGHKDRLNHWTYASYDAMDQLQSTTNANGNATQYSYCFCGGLGSITDPLNNTTSFNRDYNGNVINITSSDGFQTELTRNILGQVINVTNNSGLNLNYTYNNQGLVTNVSSLQGNVFVAQYDECDQPVQVTDAQGVTITNAFDPIGRLQYRWNSLGHEEFDYTPQGLFQHYDALRNVTYYGYDAAGRLNSIADVNNYYTNGFTYNAAGEIATLADGNGHVTSWAYDIYGRNLIKTNGNNVVVSTNGYDVNNRLTAYWTPAKGLTQYTYDANGNPLTVAFSLGTGISAAYDALNRIIFMSDAVGASAFAYQNFGAFKGALVTEDGPWRTDTVTHSYVNHLAQSLALAQPSGSWSETFNYDRVLRLHTLTAPTGTFTYNYNGAGKQISSLSLPAGSISQSYNGAGQVLSTVLQHGSTVLDSVAYTYDANGNRISVVRTDNSYVNYGYDNLNQLTGAMGYEQGGLLRGNEDLGYGYDPARSLLMRTNNTLIQTFTTDNANELVNVTRNNNLLTVAGSLSSAPTSLAINNQPATVYGDLTYAVAGGVSIVNGSNTLTEVINGTLTNSTRQNLPVIMSLQYDLNGNLISDGLKAYAYDCANELTQVTLTNGWRTVYAYDGFGRRRIRQDYTWMGNAWAKTNEVHYVYDGMAVIQERDAYNNPKVYYTRGLDQSGTLQGAGGIGGLLARTDPNGSAYYHADGNGNITMLVNISGAMMAKYRYDSYGNTLGTWGTLAAANTYRYSNKEVDTHSGLYYYGYRYYEPNLQRWLNQDPIQEWGGINLYRFVANNPVNLVDPLGLYNPISGPSGPVGPGSGLADPSVYLPQFPPTLGFPGANGGGSIYGPTAQTLAGLGLGQTAAEFGSGSASIGNNFKFYPSGFYGNQYVKAAQISKCAHAAGPWLFGASVAADAAGAWNGDTTWDKFGVNTGFGALGLFGGPGGIGVAGTYSAIDNFYPGGWEGYTTDQGNILQSNMQAAPFTWSMSYPIMGP